jgi:hypothetical protein
MAAPARSIIFDLPQGHEFPQTSFSITSAGLAAYLDAVEDSNAVYGERGVVPPLAVAARAIGALLEVAELPAGTLHTGQEIESQRACPVDVPLTFSGRIAQRSLRAGLVISVIDFSIATADGDPVLSGRTTVMAQAPGGAS